MEKVLIVILLGVAHCTSQSNEPNTYATLTSSRFGDFNQYYLYNRLNAREAQTLQATAASAIASAALFRTNTVVLIHDHAESSATSLLPIVKDAFLTVEDISIVVVDWSIVASLQYDISMAMVPSVADGVATLIRWMVTYSRINLSRLHIVGFGAGAHIAAFTARALTTGTVARITALDPAGISWGATSGRLSPADAAYVEVVHTDSLVNGMLEAIGHVDFYPNGGITQPGCNLSNDCNHVRAVELFAASLTHNLLVGNRCADSTAITDTNCRGFTLHFGNNDMNKYGSGLFYMETSYIYPYNVL